MDEAQRRNAQARALILSKALKAETTFGSVRSSRILPAHCIIWSRGWKNLRISSEAWACVRRLDVRPKMVFAHPELLQRHPETSLYYRGIATLSLKRVSSIAGNVDNWENTTILVW